MTIFVVPKYATRYPLGFAVNAVADPLAPIVVCVDDPIINSPEAPDAAVPFILGLVNKELDGNGFLVTGAGYPNDKALMIERLGGALVNVNAVPLIE